MLLSLVGRFLPRLSIVAAAAAAIMTGLVGRCRCWGFDPLRVAIRNQRVLLLPALRGGSSLRRQLRAGWPGRGWPAAIGSGGPPLLPAARRRSADGSRLGAALYSTTPPSWREADFRGGRSDGAAIVRGFEHSKSEFATHVLVEQDDPIGLESLVDQVLGRNGGGGGNESSATTANDHEVEEWRRRGRFLIELGSVWHLPNGSPRSPSLGAKPARATDPFLILSRGDYVRIHHHPRRFPAVHRYDWDRRYDPASIQSEAEAPEMPEPLPGVVVESNEASGWLVLNKPEHVPVHMTVDNCRENVQWCVREARIRSARARRTRRKPTGRPEGASSASDPADGAGGGEGEDCYVSTPQRLDQNTSGLLVLATSKVFANYFAGLLQSKTHQQLLDVGGGASSSSSSFASAGSPSGDAGPPSSCPIHKLYRCLVCLSSGGGSSVRDASNWLRGRAESGEAIRHFLEPSIRAPKRFVLETPANAADAPWQECLLRIRHVGPVCSVLGNDPGRSLAASLWAASERRGEPSSRRPATVHAVAELEVELLTGRTHQIRGQLSAAGFPLVGDVQYGGAVPSLSTCEEGNGSDAGPPDEPLDRLALQCCQLEFIDPDIVQRRDGTVSMARSGRWNRFRLDRAWWTPFMERYQLESNSLVDGNKTANLSRENRAESGETDRSQAEAKAHLLPPRVSLSPGRNKYVLIRASHPTDPVAKEEWFVKSAAPSECGGPYHGNVAQDLREWIEAAGFEATVTGGGRIYFRPDENCAVVYGFSYGFGRGDHDRAAAVVRESGIYATVDHSPDLY